VEEVRILEITINAKQVLAVVWTMIAIVISLIVILAMWWLTPVPWWVYIAAFFGIFLVVTLPVYLLIALWGIATRYDNE
jgi:hypothetical protein